jgi:hypothetical protein
MTRISHKQFLVAAATAAAGLAMVGCADRIVVYRYPVPAQTYPPAQMTYAPPSQPGYAAPAQPGTNNATTSAQLTAQEIDQLTAPVALYPDPLLAVVLPASTYPNDIASAANWLRSDPQPTDEQINGQPWDPSVKALVHDPEVFQQLAGNMEWTQALGAAFLNQQQDVMDSIQRLRAQAQAAGNLRTNSEQTVAVDEGYVQILPATPDVLFVPVYDPYLVFAGPCDFAFHRCGFFGAFFDFDCDWRHHRIDRGRDWHHDFRGDRNGFGMRPWVRDHNRAAPIMPQHFVRPGDHRSFQTFNHPREFQNMGSQRAPRTSTAQPRSQWQAQPQFHWQSPPRSQQTPGFHGSPQRHFQGVPEQRFAPGATGHGAPVQRSAPHGNPSIQHAPSFGGGGAGPARGGEGHSGGGAGRSESGGARGGGGHGDGGGGSGGRR